MPNQKPFEVKDFSGGITDNYIDGPANKAKELDNLVITVDGKLESRKGSDFLVEETVSNRVDKVITHNYDNSLFIFEDNKGYILKNGETSLRDIRLFNITSIANNLKSLYESHIADTTEHTTAADKTNTIGAPNATDLDSLIILVASLLSSYSLHDDDAELPAGWAYHVAQEASNHSLITTDAPTTLEECLDALKDFKEKFNAHDADTSAHGTDTLYQSLDVVINDLWQQVDNPSQVSSAPWKNHLFFAESGLNKVRKIVKDANNLWFIGGASSKIGVSYDGFMGLVKPQGSIVNIIRDSIKKSDNKYLFVGDNGQALEYSNSWDSINIETFASAALNAIDYNGVNLFMIVGNQGQVGTKATISGAVTLRTSGFGTSDILAAQYMTGNTWLIAGEDGKLAKTTDNGANFSIIDAGFGTTTIRTIVWLSTSKALIAGDDGKIALSTDTGATWSLLGNSPFGSSNIYTGFYGYPAATPRAYFFGEEGKSSYTTDDGANWSAIDTMLEGNDIFGSAYNATDDAYLVCGDHTKVDGEGGNPSEYNTIKTRSLGSSIYRTVVSYGNYDWIVAGDDGKVNRWNEVGNVWSSTTSSLKDDVLCGISVGATPYIGTSASNIYIAYAFSGPVASSPEFASSDIYSVCEDSDYIYVVGEGGKAARSDDIGATWETLTVGTAQNLNKVFISGSRLIVCGNAAVLYTSDDQGSTWTSRTSGFTADNIHTGLYNTSLGLYVIAGAAANLATSPDGVTWTLRTSGFTADKINDMCLFKNMMIIAGDDGKLATSINGVTWVMRTAGGSWATSDIEAIRENSYIVEIAGDSGKRAYSVDGVEWTMLEAIASLGTIYNIQFISNNSDSDWRLVSAGLPEVTPPTLASAGGTGSNYIYAFHYSYFYSIGDELFKDSGPTIQVSIEDVGEVSANNITISNIIPLTNSSEDMYDIDKVVIEIYRTTDDGTVFYHITSLGNGTTSFTDSLADATIETQESIYTTGGVLDNDAPPICKFVHITNNVAYYANVEEDGAGYPSKIRLSVQNDPDSCPEGNYVEVEDEITGINSVNNTPIVFCKNNIYRLEGIFDELGEGVVTPFNISNTIGCISNNSIVSTLEGLFFAGTDGFYVTDGWKVIKVSEDINNTYKLLSSSEEQKSRIHGVHDKINRRIIWGVQSPGATDCDKCYVLDLKFGISPNMPFTTFSGNSFSPTSFAYREDRSIIRGNSDGYILEHNSDYDSDVQIIDAVSDPDLADLHGEKEPIIYSYISCAYSFGTTFLRKWVTKMLFTARRLSDLFVQIVSYNDLSTSGIKSKNCTVIKHTSADELIEEQRWFPSADSHHRLSYKQIGITNAYSTIYASDDYALGTVNKAAKTITLVAGNWPTDILGYHIHLENDDYTNAFLISEVAAGVITVIDDSGDLPANGNYAWEIKGYKKDQRLRLEGYNIHYDYLGKTQKEDPTNQGENE